MPNETKPKTKSDDSEKSSAIPPDGKKSKKALIIVIILVILLFAAVAGGGIYFFFTKLGMGKSNFGFPGKTTREMPVGIPEMSVTQRISAAEGGAIKANLPSGYVATLTVPKGALKKDTEITLTPFPPIGTSVPNPSVQNHPANQPSGNNLPGNPPNNPPGSNNPPGGGGSNPPGSDSSDDGFGFPDLTGLSGLGSDDDFPPIINPFGRGIGGVIITPDDLIFDIPTIISFDPAGAGSNAGAAGVATTEPTQGVIVHTDPNGSSTIIPGSGSGGSTGGPIGGGGFVSGDPPTQDEAESIAEDTARASGGTCTPEFIDAIKAMADIPGYPAGSIMGRTLDDCLNLAWLREKCQNNPIALRRLYFQERLRIAESLRAPADKVQEINRLMNECVARYEFSGSGSQNIGAIMSGNTNMWVCGYLDDEWQGSMHYQLVPPEVRSAMHSFTGTISSMYLPPRGGAFGGTAVADAGGHSAGYFDLSGIPLGIWGNFDGESSLNPLNIYAVNAGNVQINMTERPCVPLAPISP